MIPEKSLTLCLFVVFMTKKLQASGIFLDMRFLDAAMLFEDKLRTSPISCQEWFI